MATLLYRPALFDGLEFVRGEVDADGRRTDTAPCGCQVHRRMAIDGPLRGHWYGDVRCDTCDMHTPPAETE